VTQLVPLEPACEWRREDLADSYVFDLTDGPLAELDAALVHAEQQSHDVLFRGVAVDQYGKARASSVSRGIGMHLGRSWPDNAKGHLLERRGGSGT